MTDTDGRNYDHDYPPSEWSVDTVAAALRPLETSALLPTYEDERTWRTLAAEPPTASLVGTIVRAAERARDRTPPDPSASRYLAYDRSGDREAYQQPYFQYQQDLSLFALAACVERDGGYLDSILDYAWRLCEWTTWLLPAHLPAEECQEGLPRPAAGEDHRVALFSARTALLLSDLDRLLGERLHPALRDRMREEVDRRVLTPFEATVDDHWGRPPTGNWNAVCNASVAVAALRFESDTDRLARIVTKAAHSLRHYLATFDADGCTPEGIAYWNFGFGHYLLFDQHLDARTGGELTLREPPVVRAAAQFPLGIELGAGRYVPFSDSPVNEGIAPQAACYAGVALDLPTLTSRGRAAMAGRDTPFREHTEMLPELWRTLACAPRTVPAQPIDLSPVTYYPGHQWWIVRTESEAGGLAVAAKGGHNGEPHNHNDCGSVVVHAHEESFLADLGAPVYDRDYFSDRRYDYLTARSLGHSVPYVNGHEQAVGGEFTACVVQQESSDERDAITFDLAACYPEAAGLDALGRTVALDRPSRAVHLADEVTFADGVDGSWQSVLVSYHPIDRTDEGFVVTGDHGRATVTVTTEPSGANHAVEHLPEAVPVSERQDAKGPARDVWRARVEPPAATRSSVSFLVTPRPHD